MEILVVADEPVSDAVVASLTDVDLDVKEGAPVDVEQARLAIVGDGAGSNTFERANKAALAGSTPWIAVEIGGIGGQPIGEIDAAVSGFAPNSGCHSCLRTRVASVLERGTDIEESKPTADRSAVRLAGAIAGRECVRLLAGDDRSIVGHVVELPYARRRFLPIPGCACANDDGERYSDSDSDGDSDGNGEADSDGDEEIPDRGTLKNTVEGPEGDVDGRTDTDRNDGESTDGPSTRSSVRWELDRDDESRSLSLEQAVERAERAIDDRVGVITSIGELESFPAPYYLTTIAETSGFSDASAPEKAAGVDTNWNAALIKAVGEALERYCSAVYREAAFVHVPMNDLERAISPADFVRPDDVPSFDPSASSPWVLGERLDTGTRTHLPAGIVHFPSPGERYVPAITTGLGLGSSTVDALYSGLTEVVERDATMIAWYSTFEPLGVAVDDERFETLRRRAASEGLSVTPLLVTQDVDVPVIAVAVHREPDGSNDWPFLAMGSAAELDATAAACAALTEALQNWMELRSIGREEADDATAAIGEYASFPDRIRSFIEPDRSVPIDTVGPDQVPAGRDALEELISRVGSVDEDPRMAPYAVRLTTRDVETLGFEAVRVVIPKAQPLFTTDPFFGERANQVPKSLGFEPRTGRSFHPFP